MLFPHIPMNFQLVLRPSSDFSDLFQQKAQDRHLLARQLALDNSIYPADGIEPVENLGSAAPFPGEIVIEKKEKAIKQAKKYQVGTVVWTDGSKLDTGNVGAAVTWRDKNLDEWKERSLFLGKNKEILDAELWATAMALEAA